MNPAPTTAVRVVLADDHPMFRYGLVAALATSSEITVVGEAADGDELLAVVERTSPDVVLTDLAMPGLDGVAAARTLLARHPELAVVMLTMREDDEAVFGALRAGVRGYLLKGADSVVIIRAVLAAAAAGTFYCTAVSGRIIDFFTGTDREYAASVFPGLTDREREVLELVATGLGNHEIARRLLLSDKTVRNHMSAILFKLGVRDRAAAVAKACGAGLGGTAPLAEYGSLPAVASR